ncbi:MAG: hypothetical protein M3442_13675 [Chloroflexota bacterium]|nr:hypothetical protein [Chloroflexota bacterium]
MTSARVTPPASFTAAPRTRRRVTAGGAALATLAASAQGFTLKDERGASQMSTQLNNELSLVRGKK